MKIQFYKSAINVKLNVNLVNIKHKNVLLVMLIKKEYYTKINVFAKMDIMKQNLNVSHVVKCVKSVYIKKVIAFLVLDLLTELVIQII